MKTFKDYVTSVESQEPLNEMEIPRGLFLHGKHAARFLDQIMDMTSSYAMTTYVNGLKDPAAARALKDINKALNVLALAFPMYGGHEED